MVAMVEHRQAGGRTPAASSQYYVAHSSQLNYVIFFYKNVYLFEHIFLETTIIHSFLQCTVQSDCGAVVSGMQASDNKVNNFFFFPFHFHFHFFLSAPILLVRTFVFFFFRLLSAHFFAFCMLVVIVSTFV